METALFFMSAVFLADWSSLVFKSGFWVITTWNFTNDKWYYFLALHLNLTCVLYFLKVSACNQIFKKKVICYWFIENIKWGYIIHLFCNCGEFENVLGFIKHTGTLIHINYHVHTSLTTEEILEEACQLTVSEGNDLGIISTKGNNRMSRTESIAVLSLIAY